MPATGNETLPLIHNLTKLSLNQSRAITVSPFCKTPLISWVVWRSLPRGAGDAPGRGILMRSGARLEFEMPKKQLRLRNGRNRLLAAAALVAVACPLAWAGLTIRDDARFVAPQGGEVTEAQAQKVVVASIGSASWMLEPTLAMRPEALDFSKNSPLGIGFKSASVQPDASAAEPPVAAMPLERDATPLPPARETGLPLAAIPLPVPRPQDLGVAKGPDPSQPGNGAASRQAKNAAPPAAPTDNRSFLAKLFGLQVGPGTALAYAPTDGNLGPATGTQNLPAPSTGGIAVYDITGRVVYMPNGDRLEAHSGLGDKLDDPRYVHVRMNGATPPGTYDLTERERLFHGVRAIRLNPVGGSAAVYGRAGLLAHTFMLGPNGNSNGCISFRDYDKFLRAYLKGDVTRLVVVASRGQDVMRSIASGRTSMPERYARAGE